MQYVNQHPRQLPGLTLSLLAVLIGSPAIAGAAEDGAAPPVTVHAEQSMATVTITGEGLGATTEGTDSYTSGSSSTATKFDMSLRDTPQSISVITRARLDEFGITDVEDALESTTGISVEQVETERTYYTARGFNITNFQTDGIGVPFTYGHGSGKMDIAIFDRIEVLRGGTGLMSGMSDPSATVNFVRKRPTKDLQASASLTAGSWNKRRAEADLSGALNATGSVRGRIVGVHQDTQSHLDRYAHERSVFYGVLEADLSASTMFAIGYSHQDNNADSPLWGSLPLYDTSGNATTYDVSTSTAADWAFWDGKISSTFAELTHNFGNGWLGKAILTRNTTDEDSELFYVYGKPNPTTPGSDLYAYPSRYQLNDKQTMLDVYAQGPFSLFGRQHELVAGANWAKVEHRDMSHFGQGIGTEIPMLETWQGDYPKPAFDARIDGGNSTDRQISLHGAARLSLTDRATLIAGARVNSMDSIGASYGTKRTKSYDQIVTPYAGLTYMLSDTYSAYASYTKLFRPQFEVDVNGDRLDPVTGNSTETGIKGEFLDKQLNASLAVFKSRQHNLAEMAGWVPFAHHTASDALSSSGYELDASGLLATGWQISAGLTWLSIKDQAGEPAKNFVPKRLVRLSTSYSLPAIPQLQVGMSLKWQDDIYADDGVKTQTGTSVGSPIVTRQPAYEVLDLVARYEFSDKLTGSVNVNNVTDAKHYQSLYWGGGQAYYAAPRHVSATLSFKY